MPFVGKNTILDFRLHSKQSFTRAGGWRRSARPWHKLWSRQHLFVGQCWVWFSKWHHSLWSWRRFVIQIVLASFRTVIQPIRAGSRLVIDIFWTLVCTIIWLVTQAVLATYARRPVIHRLRIILERWFVIKTFSNLRLIRIDTKTFLTFQNTVFISGPFYCRIFGFGWLVIKIVWINF